jgi:hypothetical protein
MSSVLDQILADKHAEVAERKQTTPLAQLKETTPAQFLPGRQQNTRRQAAQPDR